MKLLNVTLLLLTFAYLIMLIPITENYERQVMLSYRVKEMDSEIIMLSERLHLLTELKEQEMNQ